MSKRQSLGFGLWRLPKRYVGRKFTGNNYAPAGWGRNTFSEHDLEVRGGVTVPVAVV
jgi:hypothetical protein